MTKYSPNKDFVKMKQRKLTIPQDARFNSLKDLNKEKREQVSPVSYKIKEFRALHRPFDKNNLKGKFPRDSQERLTSSPFY